MWGLSKKVFLALNAAELHRVKRINRVTVWVVDTGLLRFFECFELRDINHAFWGSAQMSVFCDKG